MTPKNALLWLSFTDLAAWRIISACKYKRHRWSSPSTRHCDEWEERTQPSRSHFHSLPTCDFPPPSLSLPSLLPVLSLSFLPSPFSSPVFSSPKASRERCKLVQRAPPADKNIILYAVEWRLFVALLLRFVTILATVVKKAWRTSVNCRKVRGHVSPFPLWLCHGVRSYQEYEILLSRESSSETTTASVTL